MIRNFLILVIFFVPALSSAGISFLLKQNFNLNEATDCQPLLTQLNALLYPSSEIEAVAIYGFLACDPEDVLIRELRIEVVYEGEAELLDEHFRHLSQAEILGQRLLPQKYQGLFLNMYYVAIKKNSSGDWQEVSGFETPSQMANFQAIVNKKNTLRDLLRSWSAEEVRSHIQSQLSHKIWQRWKREVLPETERLEIQFHSYFLVNDNVEEVPSPKSFLTYRLSKDL